VIEAAALIAPNRYRNPAVYIVIIAPMMVVSPVTNVETEFMRTMPAMLMEPITVTSVVIIVSIANRLLSAIQSLHMTSRVIQLMYVNPVVMRNSIIVKVAITISIKAVASVLMMGFTAMYVLKGITACAIAVMTTYITRMPKR